MKTLFQVPRWNLVPLDWTPLSLINSSDLLAPPDIHPNYDRVTASINGTEVKWDVWLWLKNFGSSRRNSLRRRRRAGSSRRRARHKSCPYTEM
ncbi:hypothetical protein F4775DRAFT_561309 [Biscogniauxia sp. FL1348]|nr:hypothetical protein F4775DRAFT_561309 [Biscogniauxia sp. FL1348]